MRDNQVFNVGDIVQIKDSCPDISFIGMEGVVVGPDHVDNIKLYRIYFWTEGAVYLVGGNFWGLSSVQI